MPSPIDDIKSRLDIVELIQSYVRLHKAGINYKANCPFHTEKTPSFFVSPTRQMWHCFGCGKGGDHFKFVMEIEGHDFPEALRMLAARAGVELRREDPQIRSERNRLYDLCEEATKTFEKSLALTPAVKAYLQKRGVKEETIRDFRVGFAPQSWDFLLKTLIAKGFKSGEIESAGLVIRRGSDGLRESATENSLRSSALGWYDRFRSRVMFPITDGNSRVVGFSGRIFGVDQRTGERPSASTSEAKYVNTPNTLIYDKSQVLYGFDKAKQEIRTKNQVVVVEGQMDCVMSHQADVKNTIAVSGTALTPQQLKILRRLCDTVISSFDTDAAGDTATKRSLALASEFEFERRIATIPSGKDPADTVLENPKLWLDAVAGAKPVVEFYFAKAFRERDPSSADGKKAISAILLPLIAELGNEIEKSHWVSELSRRLSVREDSVWAELGRKNTGVVTPKSAERAESGRIPTRRDLLEERMLALLSFVKDDLRNKEFADHYVVFASGTNQRLFEVLLGEGMAAVGAPELKNDLDMLRFKGEVLVQMTRDVEEEFLSCKRELEKECVRERLLKIGADIEKKEKAGDRATVASLLTDFRVLSNTLKSLSS